MIYKSKATFSSNPIGLLRVMLHGKMFNDDLYDKTMRHVRCLLLVSCREILSRQHVALKIVIKNYI